MNYHQSCPGKICQCLQIGSVESQRFTYILMAVTLCQPATKCKFRATGSFVVTAHGNKRSVLMFAFRFLQDLCLKGYKFSICTRREIQLSTLVIAAPCSADRQCFQPKSSAKLYFAVRFGCPAFPQVCLFSGTASHEMLRATIVHIRRAKQIPHKVHAASHVLPSVLHVCQRYTSGQLVCHSGPQFGSFSES